MREGRSPNPVLCPLPHGPRPPPRGLVPGLSLQCSGRRSRPCSSNTGMIRSRSGTSLGQRPTRAGRCLSRTPAAWKPCALAANCASAGLCPRPGVCSHPSPTPAVCHTAPLSTPARRSVSPALGLLSPLPVTRRPRALYLSHTLESLKDGLRNLSKARPCLPRIGQSWLGAGRGAPVCRSSPWQSGDRCPDLGQEGGGLAGSVPAMCPSGHPKGICRNAPAADTLSGHSLPRRGQVPPPWSPRCHPVDVLTPHSASVTSPALVLSASAHVWSHWELSDVCCTYLWPATPPLLPVPVSLVLIMVSCLMPGTNLVWITTPALSPTQR